MGERYLLIALLLLVACEPALRTIPTSEYVPQAETAEVAPSVNQSVDLCKDVNCSQGQTCKAGKCICPTGKKLCDNECISTKSCCTDKDCKLGVCSEGKCITAEECKYGEVLSKGKCECATGLTYCSEQKRCIKKDGCCVHSQCDRFERCVPAMLRTSLCIKIGEKKVCKAIADNQRAEAFEVLTYDFRITATDWLQDESITFDINNETIKIPINTTVQYKPANATLYQEGIEVLGGYCKEDTAD